MSRTLVVSFLTAAQLLCGSASAQELVAPDVATPSLVLHANAIKDFVPAGWKIEKQLDGRVDGDARVDAVLLLRDADPRNLLHNDGLGVRVIDTNPRVLVVLAADASGGFRRLAQSDQLIRRNDQPTLSDPMEEGGDISLSDRKLSVIVGFFANAGSWTMSHTTYSFRWQAGCMRLIGFDANEVQRNSGETTDTSVNLLTGSRTLTTGTIENDRVRVKRSRSKPRAAVCLESVNEDFEP